MSIQRTGQQLRSEQVRERIINEAEKLFHQYGYKTVSVRDIAAAAGVTTGALYHHFGDKESILTAIFRRSAQLHGEKYQSSPSPLEDLEELLCETMTAPVLKDGQELTRCRLFSTMRFEYVSDFEKCVSVLVDQAVEKGVFTQEIGREEIVDLFCATYRGAVLQYAMSSAPMDLRAVMKNRFAVALRAVLRTRDK